MFRRIWGLFLLAGGLIISVSVQAFDVPFVDRAPLLNGDPSDPAWEQADWRPMDQLISGSMPEADDFSGRYKLVWTVDKLYLLAEITDDILYDSHADPLDQYWEDDALEVFIDADASGGDHLFNYNAFAFHISLDNQAVDIGPYLSEQDRKAEKTHVRLFPDLVQSVWKRSLNKPNTIFWELEITPVSDDYQDSYADGELPAIPLIVGMKMGFMLAYCDSDGELDSKGREHFMGDVPITPVNGDRNLGYKDASVFGEIHLVK